MRNRENLLLSGANQDIRDHSGKKARQYLVSQEAAVSQDTFRSKYRPFREARDCNRMEAQASSSRSYMISVKIRSRAGTILSRVEVARESRRREEFASVRGRRKVSRKYHPLPRNPTRGETDLGSVGELFLSFASHCTWYPLLFLSPVFVHSSFLLVFLSFPSYGDTR